MKNYLIPALFLLLSIAAKAQSRYRTDESIGSQLRNGTAPGLLFHKPVSAKKEVTKEPVNTGSLGRQIRGNAVPGLSYQKSPAPEAKVLSQPKPEALPGTEKVAEGQKPEEKPTPKKEEQ
ncbi:MAG: hypothetical protein J7576_02345 [Siphonobacter aquaeclarae]|nr:hypothetical protein [Siphonobacter aquaeclarae]